MFFKILGKLLNYGFASSKNSKNFVNGKFYFVNGQKIWYQFGFRVVCLL